MKHTDGLNGTAPAPRTEWIVISDLHLDQSPRPGRGGGDACAAFVRAVAERGPRVKRRLVLLGDTFDLTGEPRPAAALLRLAEIHPQVLSSLGEALRAGVSIDVVTGNHDLDLARPEVWDTLTGLLGGASRHSDRLRLHPWVLHVPGVLYAEHGHQHHLVHRAPAMLELGTLSPHRAGAASPLHAWSAAAGAGRLTQSRHVVRSVAGSMLAETRARSRAFGPLLDEEAEREALPDDVVRRLAGVSRFRASSAALGVLRRQAARRWGRPPDDMLASAAGRVARVLASTGNAVPVIVFGHTHRARTEQLPGDTVYANAGTWSDDVRGHGPDQDDPRCFPHVRVVQDGRGVSVSLDYWSTPGISHLDTGARHGHE